MQDYACGSRAGVVLRLGTIVGDDPMTRFQLRVRAARPPDRARLARTAGRTSCTPTTSARRCSPRSTAPSGVYNVGAEPVRRVELVAGFAACAGRESIDFMGPLLRRVGGARLEPLARSLRVSSEHFTASTGWTPRRARFDAVLVRGAASPSEALR